MMCFSSFFPREKKNNRCYNIINEVKCIYCGKGLLPVYQLGDKVVYGVHGVCNIIALEKQLVNRKRVEYFVLEPTDQPGARFYVPTQNEAALAKLRPLMSKEELSSLLASDTIEQVQWIQDENQRKQYYRELINSTDVAVLIGMVRTLHFHKKEQLSSGKKFHLCDENFLKDAQKLLFSEFSDILGMDREEIIEYIHQLHNEKCCG